MMVFAEEELPAAIIVNADIPCRSAILIEQKSGKVLFEKQPDEKMPPASITKIMTLLLVMEALDSGRIAIDDTVTCSPHASSMGGSQIWFEPGEQMTVHELLKATAIASANDAAVALGEHIAGSEEAFVAMMNERAGQLGMKNTTFKNASGLDIEGHLTTARDIAIMSAELLRHPKIKEDFTCGVGHDHRVVFKFEAFKNDLHLRRIAFGKGHRKD
ncbi:MAG: D-alanyl-D-alanine carboxypeptidase, partial [Oscillospiraceae bacterium]|nr:D-alanyl-D-alanine carboxypeptidase [Oscillospiraceae bacterium]